MKYGQFISLLLILLSALPAQADEIRSLINRYDYGQCLVDTAHAYGISPLLIDAIIDTESSHNPRAININRNSDSVTEDVGLMQVNSRWLPRIADLGYDRKSLFDPCTNILIGTWILAQEIQHYGYTWSAVGAYNAGRSQRNEFRRARYAHRVYSRLSR